MDTNRKVLIVKGKAGLGNRFLAVLGSILYCKVNGRSICIDWSDGMYAPKGVDAFQLAFRCNFPQLAIEEISDNDVFPELWKHNLRRSVTDMIDEFDPTYWDSEMQVYSRYSVDTRRPNYTNQAIVHWSYHDDISNFFARLGMAVYTEDRRFTALRCAIREHVELSETFQRSFNAIVDNIVKPDTIGVHIRYTDNKCPLSVVLAALRVASTRRPAANIFLSTDNKDIVETLNRLYPNRIVTADKTMSDSGVPLHHDKSSFGGFEYAVRDMLLLSKCDYLIYSSRSTFGYCAALMSNARSENLVNCLTLSQAMLRQAKAIGINLRSWIGI